MNNVHVKEFGNASMFGSFANINNQSDSDNNAFIKLKGVNPQQSYDSKNDRPKSNFHRHMEKMGVTTSSNGQV